MKFKNLFFILAVSAVIFSCKKDDDGNTPSTCSNGIRDNDETGIDCGGSCTACAISSTTYYFDGTIDANTS